jgi:hypothetical protein
MKKCPVCQQTYTDENLNFCLNDGATLETVRDDPPPTVFMNKARETAETNWSNANQTNPWGNPPSTNQPNNWMSPQGSQTPSFMPPPQVSGDTSSLAIVSLALGIASVVLGICCYAGIPLGGAALVTGYLAMNKSGVNSAQSNKRGVVIGGMVTGAIGFLISVGMLLIGIIANLK